MNKVTLLIGEKTQKNLISTEANQKGGGNFMISHGMDWAFGDEQMSHQVGVVRTNQLETSPPKRMTLFPIWPISFMELVYLPTSMAYFNGEYREIYQSHGLFGFD